LPRSGVPAWGTSPSPGKPGRRSAVVVGGGAALAAAGLFAVNGTVSKLVLEHGVSSLRLVEIRCVLAAAAFAALAAARRPGSLAIDRRELGVLAVYGVTGIAMVQWLYLVAIRRMPVSISLLVEFTAPLIVALWVRFARREHVRSRIWLALALSLAGLVLVAEVWRGLVLDAVGLLAAGLAALALALYYLLGEHSLGRRDPVSLGAWTFGVAGVFWSLLLPWWSFPYGVLATSVPFHGVSLPMWLLVAWVVLLGTVAPFTLMFVAIARIGPTRAGLLGTAEPALAGVVAWVAIGEVLSPVQLAGGAVVLAGILLAVTARERPAGDTASGDTQESPRPATPAWHPG
jgi:drug/metabolite transporter (DMT)-like permease